MKKMLFLTTLAITLGLGFSAEDVKAAAPAKVKVPASTPASVAKGAALFQINCASCHGEKGLGDGPAAAALAAVPGGSKPRSLVSDKFVNGEKPEQVFESISNGLMKDGKPTAMAAYKDIIKDPAERFALVHFVLSLRAKK